MNCLYCKKPIANGDFYCNDVCLHAGRAEELEDLLQGWINNFGGVGDCEHEDQEGGRDCHVCGGHMEDEESPDLDAGHDADCIQLKTCIVLRGEPQRKGRAA